MAPVAIDPDFNAGYASQSSSIPLKQRAEHRHEAIASTSALTQVDAFTLDFAQWIGPDATSESQSVFINQLREACAGLGFFYLRNTPLDQGDLRKRIFALNRQFFALPFGQRQRISIVNSPHFRGFSKFGDERTQNAVDHRDQIDYGLESRDPITDPNLLQHYPFLHLVGPNQFLPAEVLPGHRQLVLQWLDLCQSVSHELTSALEVALGTAAGELVQYLEGHSAELKSAANEMDSARGVPHKQYARMKTIRYPQAANVDGIERLSGSTQGVGAHKDGGWITILATSPHKGLQVQSLSGDWLDVEHHPHAMIVNFGQQIERVSRGAINAATHRVLSHQDSHGGEDAENRDNDRKGDRYSVAYFSTPALNVILKPIPAASLCPEIIEVWQKAQQERLQATGSDKVVSSVPSGDLWGSDDAPFGMQAWAGITRSHRELIVIRE